MPALANKPPRYYVYTLTDPRCGGVFYVGKGTGRRAGAHEAEAARGGHSRKCERIRSIWAAGGQVQRAILSRHSDENEALKAEFDEIARVGLANLTNVLPGGVIGQAIYMDRLAEAERRAGEKSRTIVERGLSDMAPKFANFLRHNAAGDQFGMMVGSRWFDFSETLLTAFRDMVDMVGLERSREIMAPYGVNVVAR